MTIKLRVLTTMIVIAVMIMGTALFTQQDLTANNAGAPSMRTGSPGDTKSCTTCHSGTAVNAVNIMSSNIPSSGYVPGTTYTITAVCTDAARNRFGFEISPQNAVGTKLGVLTVTDVARTKLVGSGKYITHTSSGTAGTGTISWSFNWTAPAAGTGDVTFYGAFNFTNHNNNSSGDLIKLSELTVSEDLTTWTENISSEENVRLYPNPVADVVHILTGSANLKSVSIFDINGKVVQHFENFSMDDNIEIDVATLAGGTYYVSLETQKGVYSSRFIKL